MKRDHDWYVENGRKGGKAKAANAKKLKRYHPHQAERMKAEKNKPTPRVIFTPSTTLIEDLESMIERLK